VCLARLEDRANENGHASMTAATSLFRSGLRAVLLSVVVAAAVAADPQSTRQEEFDPTRLDRENGILGLQFGMPPGELKGAKQVEVSADGRLRVFDRLTPGEDWQGIPIARVRCLFIEEMLFRVYVVFPDEAAGRRGREMAGRLFSTRRQGGMADVTNGDGQLVSWRSNIDPGGRENYLEFQSIPLGQVAEAARAMRERAARP
jgi:hypothetical protein